MIFKRVFRFWMLFRMLYHDNNMFHGEYEDDLQKKMYNFFVSKMLSYSRWPNGIPWEPMKHPWHDDVIKWKHFPRNWPCVRGIHQSLVDHPHKGRLHGALMFTLICAWTNGQVNNQDAGGVGAIMTSMQWMMWVRTSESTTEYSCLGLHECTKNL